MKKVMFVVLALGLAFSAGAQVVKKADTTLNRQKESQVSKDYLIKNDNKMWVVSGDQKRELSLDTALDNGLMITKDGTLRWSNGKSMMLKNGDRITMSGKILKMKRNKKGSTSKQYR